MIDIRDAAGHDHYYSSKPPFLSTVIAGLVLLIEKASLGRADFSTHIWFFTRTTLILYPGSAAATGVLADPAARTGRR